MKRILSVVVLVFTFVLLVGCGDLFSGGFKEVELTNEEKLELIQDMEVPEVGLFHLASEFDISGNIDDESVSRLESKVEKCFSDLNHITQKLSNILENRRYANFSEINNINSFYRWSYDYMTQNQVNNLYNQNQNIDRIQSETLTYFDIEFEKKRLREFIKARHDFVKVIRISEK